uniref:Uncharacterized protein n=1 Tax=Setaria italica TaxID=4555 RepID=K3YXD3_SETIT
MGIWTWVIEGNQHEEGEDQKEQKGPKPISLGSSGPIGLAHSGIRSTFHFFSVKSPTLFRIFSPTSTQNRCL